MCKTFLGTDFTENIHENPCDSVKSVPKINKSVFTHSHITHNL
ncbi:hypothetical protein HMPREF9445_00966 [Bacteroides clarus YIT 12056]|uniref:Uncharacterized protein n=1 Tax=Bacteroides clarus YIT 12056 TaxID=762984 RepID=A0ABN0CQF2_9BACE|nr:hypothetical protein HMPREF9445_00966 [Bacteroides clarus YIT 12056]